MTVRRDAGVPGGNVANGETCNLRL
jgi:hypothetical protein